MRNNWTDIKLLTRYSIKHRPINYKLRRKMKAFNILTCILFTKFYVSENVFSFRRLKAPNKILLSYTFEYIKDSFQN